ncbi:MAG TPA: radical SAM protein [Candidatus Omnitrophica bacterium]|nr:radical SAM protein [Candidatus Omnitrophota bacterium]
MKGLKDRVALVTGGEPTIREDLLKIISTLKKFGNHCSICTNGIKLSNPNYTRELGESGVDRVLLSFDGFGEGIYEVLRGRKDEYYYKLRALENLEKNNIPTALQLTVAWGVNFDQIGRVIDYAKEHSFINGVWIKPLFLPGVPFNSNFNTSHLVSVKEIKDYVCRYTGIADDYFQLFYKCKLKLYSILDKFFPGRKFSHPQEGQLFLRRKRGGLVPLIEREELENLCKGNLTGLNSYFRWLPFLLKSRLSPFTLEKNLLGDGVLAIIVASSKGPRDRDLSQPIHYLYLEPQNDRELGISSEISLITPEG